jgi:Gpi18-like mannosyltransferase
MWQKLTVISRRLAKRELFIAAAVALVLIVMSVGLGYENNKLVLVNPAPSAHYTLEPHNHLSFLSNWDGPIYLSISEHGYTDKIQANFFPLYPILIRAVHVGVPSLLDSGLLVAWACLVGALYYFLKIIKELYRLTSNLEALRGVLCFALFPTGIFLVATYTTSLFAFLALAAIYYALRKNYLAAAIFAALTTATHINGLFVALLIGLILLEEKVHVMKACIAMAVGSLGLVSYIAYQADTFGTPFAFLHAQKLHNWINLSWSHLGSEVVSFNVIFVVLVIASVIYWWRKRKSFSAYSLLYLSIIYISGKDLAGFGRYSLMAFPVEFMLYDYLRDKKTAYAIWLALSAVLWSFVTLRYVGGYTGG